MSGGGGARPGPPLAVVAAALAFASGATDVTSFTRLGAVFASVMTGNLVLFGLAVQRASGPLASHAAVAIASFSVGVGLGSLVGRNDESRSLWSTRVTATLALELVALAAFTIGWELLDGRPGGEAQYPLLAAAALAMGLQSEAMRNVGTSVSTTYLTGTLTSTVAALLTKTTDARKRRLNLAILGAAAAGAAAGGGLVRAMPTALPALLLVTVGGVVAAVAPEGVHE